MRVPLICVFAEDFLVSTDGVDVAGDFCAYGQWCRETGDGFLSAGSDIAREGRWKGRRVAEGFFEEGLKGLNTREGDEGGIWNVKADF